MIELLIAKHNQTRMEDAAARKARLKALREAAGADGDAAPQSTETAAPAAEDAEPSEPVLKFRNYAVRDEKIEHAKVRDDCTIP